jgi:hypothetical protein
MMTDEEVSDHIANAGAAISKADLDHIKGRDVEVKGPIEIHAFLMLVRMAKSVKVY